MEHYGKRKDDIMLPNIEDFATLSDSQKINVKMVQNLTSLNTALNNLQEDHRNLQSDVTILSRIIVTGNGTPSLQERVRNMESFVEGQKYWIRLVMAAIVLQVVAFVGAAAYALAQIVPILQSISRDLP